MSTRYEASVTFIENLYDRSCTENPVCSNLTETQSLYYSYLTDEETVVQGGEVICSQPNDLSQV